MLDQPASGRDEILVVDPRHELPAIAGAPAQTVPHEADQRIEYTPGSGLSVIAERSATFRVRPVCASLNASSQARATLMLNCHALGAPSSPPPRAPDLSSFGLSYRCE